MTSDSDELDYGPVFVTRGIHKGRVLYYDDDATDKTAICYAGHPLDFVGSYDIQKRFLREPTIDDLLKRQDAIWRTLTDLAISQKWDVSPKIIHSVWSEKYLILNTLNDRYLRAKLGEVRTGASVFLCHSSGDKGLVRMVNDDLVHLGIRTWLDEYEIQVGDSIVEKISDGLGLSNFLIVFLSKKSVSSVWAKREWNSFLSKQLSDRNSRILPAVLDDCTIPTILRDLKYADFRDDYYDGFDAVLASLRAFSAYSPQSASATSASGS